jgi:allantoinase
MPWDTLILGGEVVTPDGVKRLDVAIEGDSIVELSPDLSGPSSETIDAAGLHVFPGLIDPHVHFNEPGRTDWEGFDTGSAALAAGGGTCFFDMPLNSHPPTLDGESFDLKLEAALKNSRTDFALWGGLTPKNLDKMEELAERGVVGFKAFMCNSGIDDFHAVDDYTLYRGMQIAARLGLVVAVHAENDSITAGLARDAIWEGRTGALDYSRSRPIVAEVEAIRRVTALAFDTNCELHIVHVSSFEGASEAHAAFNGGQVTFETCPHYLLLTEEDLPRIGAAAKCAPPLREADHGEMLWQRFHTGEISFVASDHSPAPASMKRGENFFQIWGGIAGVQSTLAAMLTRGGCHLREEEVAEYTALNVAKRFGIARKGRVTRGVDADLTLVDLAAEYTLTRDLLLDRHKLSPYVGRRFRGLVRRTMVRGRTVFLDGKTVGDFRGRLVKPARTARSQHGPADA